MWYTQGPLCVTRKTPTEEREFGQREFDVGEGKVRGAKKWNAMGVVGTTGRQASRDIGYLKLEWKCMAPNVTKTRCHDVPREGLPIEKKARRVRDEALQFKRIRVDNG